MLTSVSPHMLSVLEHRFNHDLLIDHEDREVAKARWPALAGVLVNKELVDAFRIPERAAAAYKRRIQWAGTVSVLLALFCFVAGVCELSGAHWPERYAVWLGFLALASLAAAYLASRFCSWRRRWLVNRFIAERLRQWHFMRLLKGRNVACALGHGEERSNHGDDRHGELSVFMADLRNSAAARMAAFRDGTQEVEPLAARAEWPAGEQRAQVVDAYYTLRLRHQLDFATHKLSLDDRTFVGLSGQHLRSLTDGLAAFTLFASVVLVVASSFSTVGATWRIAAAILILALSGVAVRAWRDGLAVGEDIERYQDYRRRLELLLARWKAAANDDDRLETALNVEETVADELRRFLQAHQAAQFLF